MTRYILIEYDPERVGVDGGDLFVYLQNEFDNDKIQVNMREHKNRNFLRAKAKKRRPK